MHPFVRPIIILATALAPAITAPEIKAPPETETEPEVFNIPGTDEIVVRSKDGIMISDDKSLIIVRTKGHPTDTMKKFMQGYLQGLE
jgi:hypothetical protein